MEQLEEIVKLASMPLPERPDGIVCVAKFTSQSAPEGRSRTFFLARSAVANKLYAAVPALMSCPRVFFHFKRSAKATEAEYERMARKNPATLHLRCFNEYENANILFGQADVTVLPTFDIFYGGE